MPAASLPLLPAVAQPGLFWATCRTIPYLGCGPPGRYPVPSRLCSQIRNGTKWDKVGQEIRKFLTYERRQVGATCQSWVHRTIAKPILVGVWKSSAPLLMIRAAS